MNKPHKSTTTPEYFFHIENQATVFVRKDGDKWSASVALLDHRDQFSRKAGRCVSRRKYFQGKRIAVSVAGSRPTYEEAERVARFRAIEHDSFRAVRNPLEWLTGQFN